MVLAIFFLCCFLLFTTSLSEQCTKGQILYEDGGPCIPCTQPCFGESVFCTAQCRYGCGCPLGYMTLDGVCVPPYQCLTCPRSQIYYPPGQCLPCTLTCDEFWSDETYICLAVCLSDQCGCPPNYVTDKAGNCILPEECPSTPIICSKNRIFYERNGLCAPCIQSCELYLLGEQPVCTKICRTNVCECPDDYVKDALGNCITKKQCASPQCKYPGEKFYTPADGCAPCERTCKNVYQLDYACTEECASNICRCHLGYVRTETGECIPEDKCPNICPPGEVFYHGDSCLPCDRSCDSWYQFSFPCTYDCKRNQCGCKYGYVRNEANVCVPTSKCPFPVCGPGERFYGDDECRSCEQLCLNVPQDRICTRNCENNVCGCLDGYKRDGSNSCTAHQCQVLA